MRSFILLAAAAPALIAATPERVPHIKSLQISGSGCSNKSNSVKAKDPSLGDSATFTFDGFEGDDTDNCQIHIVSEGASPGWQVAIKDVSYQAKVGLKSGSRLDAITTTYWSEKAADTSVQTGSLTCAGPDIRDTVTIKSSTDNLVWSKCTGPDGYPGDRKSVV